MFSFTMWILLRINQKIVVTSKSKHRQQIKICLIPQKQQTEYIFHKSFLFSSQFTIDGYGYNNLLLAQWPQYSQQKQSPLWKVGGEIKLPWKFFSFVAPLSSQKHWHQDFSQRQKWNENNNHPSSESTKICHICWCYCLYKFYSGLASLSSQMCWLQGFYQIQR